MSARYPLRGSQEPRNVESSKLMLGKITIAPSIGPILGGSLSYAVGWTWIFWFLCITARLCLSVVIVLCLPRTSRQWVDESAEIFEATLHRMLGPYSVQEPVTKPGAGCGECQIPCGPLILLCAETILSSFLLAVSFTAYTLASTHHCPFCSPTAIALPSGRQVSYTCLSVSAVLSQRSSLATCWTKHIATLGQNGVSRSTKKSEMTWTIFLLSKHVQV